MALLNNKLIFKQIKLSFIEKQFNLNIKIVILKIPTPFISIKLQTIIYSDQLEGFWFVEGGV